MDAYENMIRLMNNYPKNHYKFLGLQKKVNEHISGLKITAKKMAGTNVAVLCSREAKKYENMLRTISE